jgi:hypothetical protein
MQDLSHHTRMVITTRELNANIADTLRRSPGSVGASTRVFPRRHGQFGGRRALVDAGRVDVFHVAEFIADGLQGGRGEGVEVGERGIPRGPEYFVELGG